MSDRSSPLLRWTIVLTWVAIAVWTLFVYVVYGANFEYQGALVRLIPSIQANGALAILLIGTAVSIYVVARGSLNPKRAIGVVLVGVPLLLAFGAVGLPAIGLGLLYVSIVLFPILLVILSWLVHRHFRTDNNEHLPTFGVFLLGVLEISYLPLYWYSLYVPIEPLDRNGILALTGLGCLVILGISTLIIVGSIWRVIIGRSFLDWWRNPGNQQTDQANSKVGPSRTGFDDFIQIGIVLYWIVLSILMYAWRAKFVDYDVVAPVSYLLSPASPFPPKDYAILSGVVLFGAFISIVVISRSFMSLKRALLGAPLGVILLVGIGINGLPVIEQSLIYGSVIPMAMLTLFSSLILHRGVRGSTLGSAPPLGVFVLSALAVAYLPLFSNLMVNPIFDRPRVGMGQLILLGHAVAFGIAVFSVPGALRAIERRGERGEKSPNGRSGKHSEWLLHTGSPDGNPVSDSSETVSPVTDSKWRSDSFTTTSPVQTDGTLVIGGRDESLRAVESTTGEHLWEKSLDCTELHTPAIEFRSVYYAGDSVLGAIDLDSGTKEWDDHLSSPIAGPPVPHEDTLYISCVDGTILARNAKDGTIQWETQLEGPTNHEVAVADGRVFATSPGGNVTALDATSGTIRWEVEIDAEEVGAPVVSDGTVYVTSQNGAVWMVDATDGSNPRPTTTNVDNIERPAVTENAIVVAGANGVVATIEHDGRERWRVETDEVTSSPVVFGESVYIPTESGVEGFGLRSGDHLWAVDTDGDVTGLAPTFEGIYIGTVEGAIGVPDSDAVLYWGSEEDSKAGVGSKNGGQDRESEGEQVGTRKENRNSSTQDNPEDNQGTNDSDEVGVQTGHSQETRSPIVQSNQLIETVHTIDSAGHLQSYRGDLSDGTRDAFISVLSSEYADDEDVVSSFMQVARQWSGISKNTNVATVYGIGETPRPWIAFDDGDGKIDDDLSSLERETRVEIVLDLAEGIRTAGMYNVVHAGLCPSVVHLLGGHDSDPSVTIADWGLNRSVQTAIDGWIEPTPYSAPEQLKGDGEDSRTDIYRLAGVAYYLLTENEPFPDESDLRVAILNGDLTPPTGVDETLPASIDEVIERAMEPDPGNRFSTPYDFRQAFSTAFR